MKVGDLVKHTGLNDVTWIGIITEEKPILKSDTSGKMHPAIRYLIEWTFGERGWFYCSELEAV